MEEEEGERRRRECSKGRQGTSLGTRRTNGKQMKLVRGSDLPDLSESINFLEIKNSRLPLHLLLPLCLHPARVVLKWIRFKRFHQSRTRECLCHVLLHCCTVVLLCSSSQTKNSCHLSAKSSFAPTVKASSPQVLVLLLFPGGKKDAKDAEKCDKWTAKANCSNVNICNRAQLFQFTYSYPHFP